MKATERPALNATADGLADLKEHVTATGPDSTLAKDLLELRSAIGLEARRSTSHNAK